MAPELFQYRSPRPTTAVDMYSLGVLVWCAARAHAQRAAMRVLPVWVAGVPNALQAAARAL